MYVWQLTHCAITVYCALFHCSLKIMAGHSKWNNIKRTKGKADAARANVFTKIGREIAVAVKLGGADVSANYRLRDAVAKAKAANMPNDNISRGIKKASGELSSINYEAIVYEGYAVDGIAVIVETLTDNKNRTAGEVRHIFDKYGAGLGTTGCVSYLFDYRGIIVLEKVSTRDDDIVFGDVLDAGADDFEVNDDVYEVVCAVESYSGVRDALETKGYKIIESSLAHIPKSYVPLSNSDKFNKMLDMFDDNDDVQQVYHNAQAEGE